MTSKAGHTFTAGPVVSNGHTIRTADENNITRRRVATAHGPFGDAEKAANAHLIAEAFNVAHETGLTPRQLAERLAYWLDFAKAHIGDMDDEELASFEGARAATAKAEGSAKPFYGAECQSYPNCSGGCGCGCTHEIETAQAKGGA